jgi:ubiquitin carboxyl-terminal hydrolase 25/28
VERRCVRFCLTLGPELRFLITVAYRAEAFRHLGFHVPSDEDRTIQGKGLLAPPSIDPSTEAGQRNRGRLLRAWVELSAWLAMYMKQRCASTSFPMLILTLSIFGEQPPKSLKIARSELVNSLWSEPPAQGRITKRISALTPVKVRTSLVSNLLFSFFFDDVVIAVPRLDLHAVRADLLDEKQWQVLGLTVRTHKADLVEYAYRQQVHCDPPRTPSYLFLLERISHVELLPNYMQLQAVVVIEKSKGLWTTDDVNLAAQMLGFGEDGHLRISWDSDVEDDFLMKAWWNMWKRVDNEFDYDIEFQLVNRGHQGSKKEQRDAYRRDLKEALRILCQSKGSKEASKMYEQVMRMSIMSLADAYQQLGASADFDDSVMITIYNMRVSFFLLTL